MSIVLPYCKEMRRATLARPSPLSSTLPLRPAMTHDFSPKSDFLRTLMARGFVHQCSDFAGLDEKALAGGLPAYIGFDSITSTKNSPFPS